MVTEHRGAQVVAAIADTSCGIPEECMDQVFEPFFTIHPRNKALDRGWP
jgi:C4-dicarboxylate-specific signal transduction histidine kinase